MLKFCKNLAGPCPAPTYLPTYLPYLWETKKRNHSTGEGGVPYQLKVMVGGVGPKPRPDSLHTLSLLESRGVVLESGVSVRPVS